MEDILARSRQEVDQVHTQRAMELRHVQQISSIQDLEQTLITAISTLISFLDGKVTKTEVVNQLQAIHTPDVAHVVKAVQQLNSTVNSKNINLAPLTDALRAIHQEIQTIPKELPESKDSIEVSNLTALDKHFTSLEKAISSLKLTAQAPKVDVKVPDPKVVVQEANLLPLQQSLLSVVKAVRDIKLPQLEKLDLKPVTNSLDTIDESISQVGKKIDESNKRLKALIERPMGGGGGGGSLPFESSTGSAAHVTLDSDGNVPVMPKNGLLPFKWDDLQFSNADVNGNYQTGIVKSSGSTVATLTLAYDGSNKLTRITRT